MGCWYIACYIALTIFAFAARRGAPFQNRMCAWSTKLSASVNTDPNTGRVRRFQPLIRSQCIRSWRDVKDVKLPLTRQSDNVPFEQSEEHTSELQSLRHLVCRLL